MFRSVEQKNFASIITSHIQKQDAPLFLEGGTGLGKTRAYLASTIQAASSGKKIAIVLPTHQLIDQLLNSTDLEAMRGSVTIADFRPSNIFEERKDYEANKQVAINAQVMFCTMASVIIDQRLGGEYNGVTNRDYILFDEADQLPDMSALQSNFKITVEDLKELGIKPTSADETLKKVLAKSLRTVEPEIKAAAKVILEAIEEPAWYQKGGFDDEGNLVLTHKLAGRLLKNISNRNNVAFTSATLSVNGNFKDFKNTMGIKNISVLSGVIEPEKHGQLSFHVEPYEKESPEWLEATINTVNQSKKPCLVITTSHKFSNRLGECLPNAVVRSGEETTTVASQRVSQDGVLVASGAWAGLDTPIQWQSIVIPQVPFGQPQVVEGEIITQYLDARNTAVRRLRQAIGRGIRNPDSVCSIYFLDDRVTKLPKFVPERFASIWQTSFSEGNRTEVTLSKAERDPSLRKTALKHYGLKCMACNFVPKVAVQLEVHHLEPIAEGVRQTTLKDLAVLCANCHRLAHSINPPIGLVALKDKVVGHD